MGKNIPLYVYNKNSNQLLYKYKSVGIGLGEKLVFNHKRDGALVFNKYLITDKLFTDASVSLIDKDTLRMEIKDASKVAGGRGALNAVVITDLVYTRTISIYPSMTRTTNAPH